jgi:hypothetical protein
VKGDSKADVVRIAEKIEQYKEEFKDPYGIAYVKDVVRMAFYFSNAISLQ